MAADVIAHYSVHTLLQLRKYIVLCVIWRIRLGKSLEKGTDGAPL
jgi:hypothetical protein